MKAKAVGKAAALPTASASKGGKSSASKGGKGSPKGSPKKAKDSSAEAAAAAAAELAVMNPGQGESSSEEEAVSVSQGAVPVSQAAVARAASTTAAKELEASKARIAALERELQVLSVQFHFIFYAFMVTSFDCRKEHRSHLPLQESARGHLVWH
jgi:hypothetical protein